MNATMFVRITGRSFFIRPYHIQSANPESKVESISTEMSVAFFSLIIFTSCGNNEADVSIPALMPTTFCLLIYLAGS